MTEMPKVAFLSTGKTPLELSVSIHCTYKMMDAFANEGFGTGALYTEILNGVLEDKVKHACITLEHLCMNNDVVVTVGCEGFSEEDVIPDITEYMCEKKAVYFSNVLCGSQKVYYDDEKTASEARLKVYPDKEEYFATSGAGVKQRFSLKHERPFDEKKHTETENISLDGQTKRDKLLKIITGPNRKITGMVQQKKGAEQNADAKDSKASVCISVKPSRATAGIHKNTVILNFSNDVYSSVALVRALSYGLSFAVYNLTGKNSVSIKEFNEKMSKSSNFNKLQTNRQIVNK